MLFSVSALGSKPFSYQWNFNGTNIDGATNTLLMLTNVQFSQAGGYAVLLTNIYGSVQSSNATLTVVPCDPAPSGMVSWWRAEGDANDSIGTNNGTPTGGITYTNGEVGQAFVFNNTSSYIPVPASPGLDIGTGSGFTIECWVQPNAFNVNVSGPIIEWDSATTDGLQLWTGSSLFGNIKDTSGNAHTINFVTVFDTNNFQHVAMTYDKSSGLAVLYYNGVAVTNANFGSITPQTTYPVNIGRRTGQPIGLNDTYGGLMDELSLYNCALSSNEISAIYIAGSAGKCFTPAPPTITSQPANLTVAVGGTATFSVTASGTAPLSYQWNFKGTNLSGATNSLLTLTNVQSSQAGNYAVLVTNLYGSVLSSNAMLTVNPLQSCDPPPSGLVSWWPGEGTANDSVGTNNGTLQGGVSFAPGEVGQAFVFNGSSTSVQVPASSNLNVGLGAGFTLETWINPVDIYSHIVEMLLEWNNGARGIGVHLALSVGAYGDIYANIRDTTGGDHAIYTSGSLVATNVLQHVALTYDKASGVAVIYLNGAAVTNKNLGSFIPQTSYNLYFGKRASGPFSGSYFNGLMDELSLYNRALSSDEISAIYIAGSAGKCFTVPPSITTQPTNQTVTVGGTATFSVTASGAPPLSYQWNFNGTNLSGATNQTLTLTNVRPSQAGNYAVLVTNVSGSILSSNAMLTVPLHHFAWGKIPSPRFVNTPFSVTIQARDMTNGIFTNFTGFANLSSTNSVAITPSVSGNFVQGVWTGAVVISQTASNLVLQANDGLGHFGFANPINIINLPSLEMLHFGNIALYMWPVGYSGFVLETSGNLSPATWVVVPYSPIQIGDEFLLPLNMTGTNGFYRLRFPGP